MRNRFFSYAVILTLIGALNLTTGCAWWKKNFGKKQQPTGQTPPPMGSDTGIPMGTERGMLGAGDRSQFAADTVYFDYDSAKVRPSEVSKLETVAAAMKGSSKSLIVEGYTDERGTAEYNRALGERRAQACREELVHMGVSSSRITTISYGKERPAELGHDEAAWSKNRRCEFVVAGP
jgi:peptidoglycan-associated lipoprotein